MFTELWYSLINIRQLKFYSIEPKLDIGLFVDLDEFPSFYQFLHDVIIKLFCFDLLNNFLSNFMQELVKTGKFS